MTTTALTAANTRDISDRAFRVLHALSRHPEGEWVTVPVIAEELKLRPHQVRFALSELCGVGLAEKRREYLRRGETGRPTSRTRFRLTSDTTSEAPA